MGVNSFRDAKYRLVEQIRTIKAQCNGLNPPSYQGVNDSYAEYLGIKVEEKKLDFDYGGYIPANPPSRHQPIIWIDPDGADSEHQNFTYFHEITHHIIREDNDLYSFLNQIADRNEDLSALEDRFANIGAAELIIPSDFISTVISEKGFSISLLPELDHQFPASKPAIAIQLAQCSSHKCFVVVCNYGIRLNSQVPQAALLPHQPNQLPHLFVQYSTKSPSQEKYTIAKFTTIPVNHLLYKVFETRQSSKGKDRIPFRSGTEWLVDCDAIYFKGRVYAAFNVTQPPPSSTLQPSLF